MKSGAMKAVFNWSGGKDSALALHKVLQEKEYEVVSLVTTVNKAEGRSSMHGIPVSLLKKQAESIGLPLYMIDLSTNDGMVQYEEGMKQCVDHFTNQGVKHFIFGDICLHDVKSYREEKLAPYGITVVEPLWGKTSREVMDDFLTSGLQTVVVTTTADILDERYLGRVIDRDFVDALPPNVDVCGENGEYHTFCYAGDLFKTPVNFTLGKPRRISYQVKLDDGTVKEYMYCFADLRDGELCFG